MLKEEWGVDPMTIKFNLFNEKDNPHEMTLFEQYLQELSKEELIAVLLSKVSDYHRDEDGDTKYDIVPFYVARNFAPSKLKQQEQQQSGSFFNAVCPTCTNECRLSIDFQGGNICPNCSRFYWVYKEKIYKSTADYFMVSFGAGIEGIDKLIQQQPEQPKGAR